MSKLKICPECGNIMYYNSYFDSYICNVCGYEDNTESNFCPFCHELQKQKDIKTDGLRTEYKVALLVEHYDCPNDPNWCTGLLTGTHQTLNFCPVCGKSLKE